MTENYSGGLHVAIKQQTPVPLDARLNCGPGELLALVGPSGSGKTTILRSIAGLHRPRNGEIRCGDATWLETQARVDVPPHLRSVGLVFQSYALFPHMTVLGNVLAALGHRDKRERMSRATELIDLVHLAHIKDRRPAFLSGGEQQRVAVARALARDPRVLLLDEPFSAVDKVTRQKLYRELAELRRTLSIPIVLVTHDFDEAARLADRMALIHRGAVIQDGTPREVLSRPVNVTAARLVDLKNMFEGTITRHDAAKQATTLQWAGGELTAPYRPDFPAGSKVAWTIPSTDVILHRGDAAASGDSNRVMGTVGEMLMLSETTAISVFVGGRADVRLAMTIPEHYARRNKLSVGDAVTLSLLTEGIHLMIPEVGTG